MTSHHIATTLAHPYGDAVETVPEALASRSSKSSPRSPSTPSSGPTSPLVILGACRRTPACRALTAEPSIAAVLRRSVVVRALNEEAAIVEAFNRSAMIGLAHHEVRSAVAAKAKHRLTAALTSLDSPEGGSQWNSTRPR